MRLPLRPWHVCSMNVNTQPFDFFQKLLLNGGEGGGGVPGGRFFWPWLKFLLTLRDAHPIPQIWSHYCKRIVFWVWLIYLSGWILIRVEKTNSLLLNGQPFFLFSSLSAGDLKARERFFSPLYLMLSVMKREDLYPHYMILTVLYIAPGLSL